MIGSVIIVVSCVYVGTLNWSKMMVRTNFGKFMDGNVLFVPGPQTNFKYLIFLSLNMHKDLRLLECILYACGHVNSIS